MAKNPQLGTIAPDFAAEGTHGPFRLSAHRGERVVLLFYPGDNSMICTRQFCSYRDRVDEFSNLGVRAVGISPKTSPHTTSSLRGTASRCRCSPMQATRSPGSTTSTPS